MDGVDIDSWMWKCRNTSQISYIFNTRAGEMVLKVEGGGEGVPVTMVG